MMGAKERFLMEALERFKGLVENGECSRQDIAYFCDFSRRELENRGVSIGTKAWLTKEEASESLGVSTSTFDRLVLKGCIQRGMKKAKSRSLVWRREQVEQLKTMMLLKTNN